MANRMADLQSCLALAISMRDADLIQSIRDDIQDYKEEQAFIYNGDTHATTSRHGTNTTGN